MSTVVNSSLSKVKPHDNKMPRAHLPFLRRNDKYRLDRSFAPMTQLLQRS
jgi:hypothetical protein